MKTFTEAREASCQKKLYRADKLITEALAVVDECSRGDYRARDTQRIVALKSVAKSLRAALSHNSDASSLMRACVKHRSS